jgi:hypothetical protein
MTAKSFLHDLTTRGIILTPNGNRLRVDGSENVLTEHR